MLYKDFHDFYIPILTFTIIGNLLIPAKDIPCIYLILHVIQTCIIAVGDDGIGLSLELGKVVDNEAAEEVGSGDINDHYNVKTIFQAFTR